MQIVSSVDNLHAIKKAIFFWENIKPHPPQKSSMCRLLNLPKEWYGWRLRDWPNGVSTDTKNKSPNIDNTVDSRYLEVQGTLWNTSRYPVLRHIRFAELRKKLNSINHI